MLRIVAAGVLAFVITACGDDDAEDSVAAPPQETEEVTVILDWLMEASYAQLLYGIENGIFADHGIELEIIPGQGSDLAMGQINEGEVDFAFTDLETYLVQRIEGDADATALYAWLNQPTIGVAALEPIETAEDMVGTTWGTVGFSSGPQVLPFVLEENGVDPDQVTIERLDFSVLYPALLEGQLDSVEAHVPGSAEGLILDAEEQDITVHFTPLSDWGLRGYSKMLVAPNDTIDEDPDLVRRFVAALHESMTEAMANASTEDIGELLVDFDEQLDPEVQALVWEDFKAVVEDPGPLDPSVMQETLDRMADVQTLDTSSVEVDELYTNEFIPSS